MTIVRTSSAPPAIGVDACAPQSPDSVAPSRAAPHGLTRDQTPQFVGVGWDDNGDAEGMQWALGMHRRLGGHASFFVNSIYGSADEVKRGWLEALADGHEIGNHTAGHLSGQGGRPFTVDQWKAEIRDCTDFLTSSGVMSAAELRGFRAPYLDYDDATLTAVAELGFAYDCSIEEGHADEEDGTASYWPYTLDNPSPGHVLRVLHAQAGNALATLSPHPGLWELPVYALITPPDARCAEYGVPSGLRTRLQSRQPLFNAANGKIIGFDYNLWAPVVGEGFEMTRAEFLATTKYSFDQRYAGNRAPFLFGGHTPFYVDSWNENAPGTPLAADRRAAMEELLAYAASKPAVRVVAHRELLAWLQSPQPL